MDVAAGSNVTVSVSGWHRIVGAAIAHENCGLTRPVLSHRRRRALAERVERLQIPNQPLADRLVVTAQPIAEAAATPLKQLFIQR